jgi:uncharacterized membrane protein
MKQRLVHLDLLRGLVIALMALDHTRDFFQAPGAGPENLETTTLPWFLVRWITHFCAPVFLLLAGTSVALMAQSRRKGDALQFVATRGLWLMFLEPTWVSISWYFGVQQTHLGVLWAIGGSMVLLSGVLAAVPDLKDARWQAAVGALGVALTGVVWAVPADLPVLGWLCQPQSVEIAGHTVAQSYAILPWTAVLMCGFGASGWLAHARARVLVPLGLGMIALWFGLRWMGWGDPGPWEVSARGASITVVDFLAASKYPPSPVYLLMTLGPAVLVLAALKLWTHRSNEALRVFGQVPMFFYLVHLPLIHLAGVLHAGLRWGSWGRMGTPIPSGVDNSPALVLGAWALLVVALWWPAKQWRALKSRRRDLTWLRYL